MCLNIVYKDLQIFKLDINFYSKKYPIRNKFKVTNINLENASPSSSN